MQRDIDWGRLVTAYAHPGGLFDVLVFEAADGTIRRQSNNCKAGDKPHWEVTRE